MSRVLAFVPIAFLALVLAASAFVLTRNAQPPTVTAGQLGRPAPAYALARLEGGAPIQNDAFRGRTYVINLFGSYCVPCRAEHAQLLALKARGVPILGVAYKDRPNEAAAFLNALGNPYEVTGLDANGRFGLDLGIAGVPETFVIGPDGRILAVHRGPLADEEMVAREILPALAPRT